MIQSFREQVVEFFSALRFAPAWVAVVLLATFVAPITLAQTPTTTTLVVSPSTSPLAARTAVTLTATVTAGATTLHVGQVTFCNTAGTTCPNRSVLGLAQLTSAGTAVLKLVPGGGAHNYKAFFAGTPGGTTVYAASSSASQAQTVSPPSPPAPSSVVITSSGVQSNYTLTATVSGFSSVPIAGSVSFFDTTNNNYLLGTATLGASTSTAGFTYGPTSPINIGGNFPFYVANGDFNGDGIQDLAVERANGTVTILLGNGTGGFTAASGNPISSGATYAYMAVGDFNDDGILDLALSSQSTNNVMIFLGDGTGHFTTGPVIATGGTHPNGIRTGDFNGDGIADLAVANQSTNNMSILLGDGTGHFTRVTALPAVASAPYSFAVGDFNGDGKQDLAVPGSGSGTMTILLGDGTGHFSAAPGSPVTVHTNPTSVAAGDFNDDGITDLAVANAGSNNVSVLRGDGTGRFTNFAGSPVATGGTYPANIVVADFNGNGEADLATENNNSNTVTVLSGNGTGAFTQYTNSPFPTGSDPQQLTVGNFDGLGPAELAVVNGNSGDVTILLNVQTQRATATVSGVSVPGHGTHQADATYAGDADYITSTSNLTPLTATPIPTTLALTPAPTSSTYGQQVVLSATLNPFVKGSLQTNGETVTFKNGTTTLGTGTLSTGVAMLNTTSLPAGTDSLTAVYPGDPDFVTSTSPAVPFVVTKATPVITWANPASITYGTALSSTQLNATANVAGTFAYTPAAGTVLHPGSQTLSVTFTPTDTVNYVTATGSTTIMVTKAVLTVTANASSKTYGAANPTFTDTITGFVNGDTQAASVTGAASLTTVATAASPVGGYPIVAAAGTLAATNYTFIFVNGTLTVDKAVLTVAANPATRTYGTANPAFTDTITGFVNGDTQATAVTGAASLTTTATAASPAASYLIIAAVGTLAATNYSFIFTNSTLTVTQAVLLVTADSTSRAYGAVNPTFTDTITGFVNGDTQATAVTGAASLTSTATTASPAGAYSIVAAAGTLAATNYTFTFANGTLTVTKAVLTVTANPANKTYGAANPAFTDTITGFVNGDTQATAVTGAASLTTAATPVSPAGTYPIVAGEGTLASADYSFTFVNGTLTVAQAVLTVTANPSSKTYGAANPTFTDTITGFVNGDTQATAVTGAASLTTAATAASPVGTYPIIAAAGTLAATNYTFAFVNGTLTVTQAVLTVTANPATREYGVANPAFTDTITGFVNGDTQATAVTGAASLTTTATTASPAGIYTIVAADGTLAAVDYTFTFVNGTLTVSKGVLTVTANPATRTYGAANPIFTDTITGFVNGDTPAVVTGTASLTTTAIPASPVGPYPIVAAQGTLAAASYTFAFVDSSLAVTGAPLTVVVNNATREYGAPDPPFSGTIGGAVNGDQFTATYSTTATVDSPLGTYPITAVVIGAAVSNYDVTVVPGVLTVTQVTTTTTLLLSTADTVTYGDPVTLTAYVTPHLAGTATTTGTASFYDGGTLLGTAAISPFGEASFTPTVPFTVGIHPLTTVYSGDATFLTSTSPVTTLTVDPLPPIPVRLDTSENPSMFDQPVTFTATVPTGATGTIQFRDGGTSLGDLVTIVGTTASTTTSTLAIGSHSITAVYSGDGTHLPATSPVLLQDVVKATAPSVVLVSSSNPVTFGNPVTFTATLPSDATGTIKFLDGTMVIGTETLAAGSASVTLSTLDAGTHHITAVYSGDSNYNPETSAVLMQVVGLGNPMSVTVASSLNPAVFGNAVTFTSTVPADATGTVNFLNGSTSLGVGTISNGAASITTSTLSASTHAITAVYSGDANYNGATSPVLSQVVTKATPASVTIASSLNPSVYGTSITFISTVPAGATGTVSFLDGTTALGTGPIAGTTASFSISTLNAGTHSITAVYGGDANYVSASSVVLSQAVEKAIAGEGGVPPLMVSSSEDPAPAGTPVTFSAAAPPGATGTIDFYDGQTLIGSGTIVDGIATFTTSTLAPGSHTITAFYTGDTNHQPATSGVFTQVITGAPSSFTVSSTTGAQIIPPGASANYTIAITSVGGAFANSVTLSATNLPVGATYTFNPAAVTPGAAGASSQLTIAVPQQVASLPRYRPVGAFALALLLLPLTTRRRLRLKSLRLLLVLALTLTSFGLLTGCGTGGYFSQSQKTYTVTVTGTSGSLTSSTTVTLTVE